jgi:hypothetical protein
VRGICLVQTASAVEFIHPKRSHSKSLSFSLVNKFFDGFKSFLGSAYDDSVTQLCLEMIALHDFDLDSAVAGVSERMERHLSQGALVPMPSRGMLIRKAEMANAFHSRIFFYFLKPHFLLQVTGPPIRSTSLNLL